MIVGALPVVSAIDLDTGIGDCAGGWTSFSIDKIEKVGQGEVIRVYGVLKGSECLKIAFTKEQLNSHLQNLNLEATKDLPNFGTIQLLEYTRTFPIDEVRDFQGDTECYKSVESGTFNSLTTFDLCTNSNCQKRVSDKTIGNFQTGIALATCNCVYYGCQGNAGDFSNSRYYGDFDVLFKVGNDEEHITGRLGPGENYPVQTVSLQNGKAKIKWVGNLENLDGIGVPQYDSRLTQSKWDLVRDGALSEVNGEWIDFKNCFLTTGTFPESQFQYNSCKTFFDADVNNILSSRLNSYKSSNSNVIYDADTDRNNLYVSLKATPYPTFILDLDAEWVGVVSLEGKPKITQCIENQDLTSGVNNVVNFNIKNDADKDNVEFYGIVQCDDGATGFIPNFNIGSQQEKSMTAELIPTNPDEQTLNSNCALKIVDLESGNFDECFFTISVEYNSGITCSPNTLSCDNEFKNLMQCNEDGTNKFILQECQYGCEYAPTGAKCRGEKPPTPEGKCESCDAFARNLILGKIFKSQACEPQLVMPSPPFIQSNTTCILQILGLFAVPVLFIFSLLFGSDFLKRFEVLRKDKRVLWVVNVIVAGLIAYLAYLTFWIGAVAFGIYVVARMMIKGGGIKGVKRSIVGE